MSLPQLQKGENKPKSNALFIFSFCITATLSKTWKSPCVIFFLGKKLILPVFPNPAIPISHSACAGAKTISRIPNLVLLSLQGATLSSLNLVTPKSDVHQCKFWQALLLKAPLGKLLKLLKLALCYRSKPVNLSSVTQILCQLNTKSLPGFV